MQKKKISKPKPKKNGVKYVDGFVLPVPKKNINAYKRMAKWGEQIWIEHGALDYKECIGDDLDVKMGLPFTKTFPLKKGETLVFSYVGYRSRRHRDAVNEKIMKDPRMSKMPKKMPFDFKRMNYGGFKVLVGG